MQGCLGAQGRLCQGIIAAWNGLTQRLYSPHTQLIHQFPIDIPARSSDWHKQRHKDSAQHATRYWLTGSMMYVIELTWRSEMPAARRLESGESWRTGELEVFLSGAGITPGGVAGTCSVEGGEPTCINVMHILKL